MLKQQKAAARRIPKLDKTHMGTYSNIGISFSFSMTIVESRGITPSVVEQNNENAVTATFSTAFLLLNLFQCAVCDVSTHLKPIYCM